MLHDVRNSRAVGRRRTESDAEHLVVIILLLDQKNPCLALLVAEQISLRLDSI